MRLLAFLQCYANHRTQPRYNELLKIFSTLDQFDESAQLDSHFSSILISNSNSSSAGTNSSKLDTNGAVSTNGDADGGRNPR